METNGRHACETRGLDGSPKAAGKANCSDRSWRERKIFWIEQPARRFVVYFCVLVAAESLVYGTVHWLFPLL